MKETPVNKIMESTLQKMREMVDVSTIIGEPIVTGDTTLIPVWSQEDGGWSQGTGYAQYSRNTNHEFMEVLARSGILNLYKNAWTNKEYLWELYAKPYYGWGSFEL